MSDKWLIKIGVDDTPASIQNELAKINRLSNDYSHEIDVYFEWANSYHNNFIGNFDYESCDNDLSQEIHDAGEKWLSKHLRMTN